MGWDRIGFIAGPLAGMLVAALALPPAAFAQPAADHIEGRVVSGEDQPETLGEAQGWSQVEVDTDGDRPA